MRVTRYTASKVMDRDTNIQPDASGLIHHLASMHVGCTSQTHNEKERQQVEVEKVESIIPSMCRSRPWSKYKGAGRRQYDISNNHDVLVSWAIQIIMVILRNDRWSKGNRQETIPSIMELSELATSLRIIHLDLPVGRLCGHAVKNSRVCGGNNRGSIAIIHSWSSAIMAPKRASCPPNPSAPRRPQTRRATKEQARAAQSAKYYKTKIPPEVQADIERVEQKVWAEVDQGIPDTEFDELANWIQDPGKTCGRMAIYQRAITYF